MSWAEFREGWRWQSRTPIYKLFPWWVWATACWAYRIAAGLFLAIIPIDLAIDTIHADYHWGWYLGLLVQAAFCAFLAFVLRIPWMMSQDEVQK